MRHPSSSGVVPRTPSRPCQRERSAGSRPSLARKVQPSQCGRSPLAAEENALLGQKSPLVYPLAAGAFASRDTFCVGLATNLVLDTGKDSSHGEALDVRPSHFSVIGSCGLVGCLVCLAFLALQRPLIRTAWRADVGREVNGVGHGLERACVAHTPSRVFGWGLPLPPAGGRCKNRRTRHLSRVCGGANAGAWTGGAPPPRHPRERRGEGVWIGIRCPRARTPESTTPTRPDTIPRGGLAVCGRSRGAGYTWSCLARATEVPLPHWSPSGRDTLLPGKDSHPSGRSSGVRRDGPPAGGVVAAGFYRPDPPPRPVDAAQRGASLARLAASQSLPVVVAGACVQTRRQRRRPWWLARRGPRPRE